MKTVTLARTVLLTTAVYDGVLGAVFLVAPQDALGLVGVPPINHIGYLQFPAALLLIFALMFVNAARHPARHRDLIGYGLLLKLAYLGVAGGHWITAGSHLPFIWKPFVIADALFAVLLLTCWWRLRRETGAKTA